LGVDCSWHTSDGSSIAGDQNRAGALMGNYWASSMLVVWLFCIACICKGDLGEVKNLLTSPNRSGKISVGPRLGGAAVVYTSHQSVVEMMALIPLSGDSGCAAVYWKYASV
jgi:hypothetical protein